MTQATKVELEVTALQARMIGEEADNQVEKARVSGRFNDSEHWEEISRNAHHAADEGFNR